MKKKNGFPSNLLIQLQQFSAFYGVLLAHHTTNRRGYGPSSFYVCVHLLVSNISLLLSTYLQNNFEFTLYFLGVFFIRVCFLWCAARKTTIPFARSHKMKEKKNGRRRRIEEKNCLSGFYYLVYCCQITYDQLLGALFSLFSSSRR